MSSSVKSSMENAGALAASDGIREEEIMEQRWSGVIGMPGTEKETK